MASNLKSYPLAKDKRPTSLSQCLFQCRTPLLTITSRHIQLENRLPPPREPTDTFLSGRLSTSLR